ncbi:acyl-CoA dehydrogenase [Tumebacillus sp. ITR2]|uniref:Acyl-CoA dehydrogenase n=1 Tax=Tumebacillus amylolyticus TaxID=2801339 RepID=A0ABS1JEU3_9BACL|nr:acyl-CoA dehydrogenase family protein [Tumebacillus amylolyticus]MBL0388801.1 acyl-CoA dehydrogenase [Tumebacillus amylolyticus]
MSTCLDRELLQDILQHHLKPFVSEIDVKGVYPEHVMKALGEHRFFSHDTPFNLSLIQEVATLCGSTAFVLWCHLMAIDYVRRGQSEHLKQDLLPRMERGEVMGATGLSNAMKYYAGIEELKLHATQTSDGFRINGTLPFVSNLGETHWFAFLFQTDDGRRIMGILPGYQEGLTLTERKNLLGMNATATYSCRFNNVLLPFESVLSTEGDLMVAAFRPGMVLTQVGIALGLVSATNQALGERKDPRLTELHHQAERLSQVTTVTPPIMKEIFQLRLDGAHAALESAHTGMLHSGGAGYQVDSPFARRLREAYFLAIVTPTITHLEKILG